ncbi:SDR family oxidoreductase [Streptomyces sp. NBC_01298]|uniref:SDR family oxidoreductase n=1 Tax=Streptomyces sp. NBC_01298 TaxID=2903817 RepID=UPI002E15CFEA|nr:SDR family oxidoreductase [Streptomyces sp. NBC_01298]
MLGAPVVLAERASWTLHRGLAVAPVHAATKAAVHTLARTPGSDLAGRGIRVNSISPGYIVTEMFDAANPDPASHDAIRAQVPLGRLGQAQDLAETVAFLSPRGRPTSPRRTSSSTGAWRPPSPPPDSGWRLPAAWP